MLLEEPTTTTPGATTTPAAASSKAPQPEKQRPCDWCVTSHAEAPKLATCCAFFFWNVNDEDHDAFVDLCDNHARGLIGTASGCLRFRPVENLEQAEADGHAYFDIATPEPENQVWFACKVCHDCAEALFKLCVGER